MKLKCKVFSARKQANLEQAINEWLGRHPVTLETMRFEYGAVYCEDPDEHIIEHTVIVFYVPMEPTIRERLVENRAKSEQILRSRLAGDETPPWGNQS